MKGLIQRVSEANVVVDGKTVGEIDNGILLLLGIDKGDSEKEADKLIQKLLAYRLFSDSEGRMNASVQDVAGGILVVSQFTLSADTKKGLRPSFSSAAAPADAERLYHYFVEKIRALHPQVETGIFAADMKVRLLNDGPVTFLLTVESAA